MWMTIEKVLYLYLKWNSHKLKQSSRESDFLKLRLCVYDGLVKFISMGGTSSDPGHTSHHFTREIYHGI